MFISIQQYSIIDEPVEYGVGIVADTDSWTVKVLAASKSVQTSDVIFGAGQATAAKCVRQMLSSVRNMHCMRMPPEFVSPVYSSKLGKNLLSPKCRRLANCKSLVSKTLYQI